jgi:hypothetical protein
MSVAAFMALEEEEILTMLVATYCCFPFRVGTLTASSGAMLGYRLSFQNLTVPTLAAYQIQFVYDPNPRAYVELSRNHSCSPL